MNEVRLSSATKKLLDAAKADVPGAGARARMWAGMSGVVGGTVGAATTTASVMRGGASGTKLLTIGGLFGGSVTVGLASLLLALGPASQAPRVKSVMPAAMALSAAAGPLQPAKQSVATAPGDAKPSHSASSPAKAPSGPIRVNKQRFSEDSLAHEAALVSEARSALAVGNPELALRAIHAARAVRSHQLAPEELAVEEQAQRALGHGDEANGIDVQLRLQYPESALAR